MLRARKVRHRQHDAEGHGAKCDVTGPLRGGLLRTAEPKG
jgi:hypothetical protein